MRTISGYQENDFCRRIPCRDCGEMVFLVHHNGGYVVMNSLGWPWDDIHQCFLKDNPRGGGPRVYSGEAPLRSMASFAAEKPRGVRLGLIVRTANNPESDQTFLAVKTEDGIGKCFAIAKTDRSLSGTLVAVNEEDGKVILDDGTEQSILAILEPEKVGLKQEWMKNPTEGAR